MKATTFEQDAAVSRSRISHANGSGWLHLCNGLDPTRDGGMVPSILGFTGALAALAPSLTLVTPTPSRHDLVQFHSKVSVHGPVSDLRPWVKSAQIVHMHGLWQRQTRLGARAARSLRVPYLISAHGMADPWALQQKRWKKRVYRHFIEDRNLQLAACLHALAPPEVKALRQLAPRTPIALVPNGVDLRPFEDIQNLRAQRTAASAAGERFQLLFFGRLHRKKGLDLLAEAMRVLCSEYRGLNLVLAGPDDGMGNEFMNRMRELGLSQRVQCLGHVSGERAREVWASADAFVLPSYSEGFSMAVLEALAASLPVVISTPCNFPQIATSNAGITIDPTADSLIDGLRELLERSPRERMELGLRGRSLVETGYTWERMGAALVEVYHWLLGGGAPPECVVR
jgi:glycosyltransferase involved in cell wall biosynthesis